MISVVANTNDVDIIANTWGYPLLASKKTTPVSNNYLSFIHINAIGFFSLFQMVTDAALFVVVIVLTSIDVIILVIWNVADPLRTNKNYLAPLVGTALSSVYSTLQLENC